TLEDEQLSDEHFLKLYKMLFQTLLRLHKNEANPEEHITWYTLTGQESRSVRPADDIEQQRIEREKFFAEQEAKREREKQQSSQDNIQAQPAPVGNFPQPVNFQQAPVNAAGMAAPQQPPVNAAGIAAPQQAPVNAAGIAVPQQPGVNAAGIASNPYPQ